MIEQIQCYSLGCDCCDDPFLWDDSKYLGPDQKQLHELAILEGGWALINGLYYCEKCQKKGEDIIGAFPDAIPNDDRIKIFRQAQIWNEEIRPHVLKGLIKGYLMCYEHLSTL